MHLVPGQKELCLATHWGWLEETHLVHSLVRDPMTSERELSCELSGMRSGVGCADAEVLVAWQWVTGATVDLCLEEDRH